ncbi:hypothetical protein EIN_170560 [Entamoeba invadens IP1]|uniref:Uncharacterized protein n=1 Tax=Entamoeba invadens IP1 TaxID=370355 RepID=A0A0A1TVS7_ENTIV|nr:hypothetical protein EIN_170560 [Entamoeba invadens IP1]ELP84531.1 hypothetical protein EIN_170560 [Entamoeba invadens IP1]|eukprot:XP_004183877.1 hypothetical protein EIN_170560 [Entamoeba invadens IP1]
MEHPHERLKREEFRKRIIRVSLNISLIVFIPSFVLFSMCTFLFWRSIVFAMVLSCVVVSYTIVLFSICTGDKTYHDEPGLFYLTRSGWTKLGLLFLGASFYGYFSFNIFRSGCGFSTEANDVDEFKLVFSMVGVLTGIVNFNISLFLDGLYIPFFSVGALSVETFYDSSKKVATQSLILCAINSIIFLVSYALVKMFVLILYGFSRDIAIHRYTFSLHNLVASTLCVALFSLYTRISFNLLDSTMSAELPIENKLC